MGGGKGGGGANGGFSGGGASIIQTHPSDAGLLPETVAASQGMGSAMAGQLSSAAAAGQNSSTLGQQLGNQMGNYGSVQMPGMNLAQMFANAQGFNPFASGGMMSNGNPFGSPIQFGMGAGMYGAPMSPNPGAPAPPPAPPPPQGGGQQGGGGNWHGHRGVG